jgi:hypothetical protein
MEMLLLEMEVLDIVNGKELRPIATQMNELKKLEIKDGKARACVAFFTI